MLKLIERRMDGTTIEKKTIPCDVDSELDMCMVEVRASTRVTQTSLLPVETIFIRMMMSFNETHISAVWTARVESSHP